MAAAEPLSDDESAVDQVADGGPGGLALAARGSGDGAIAGVDARPPVGAEAVGDLAEDHGRAVLLLTAVVGGRDAAVAEEDEELAAPRLDLALQLASGRMGGGHPEQGIEATFGLGGVGRQRAVLQARSSLADADRPTYASGEHRLGKVGSGI